MIRRRAAAVAAVLALVAGACSDDAAPAPDEGTAASETATTAGSPDEVDAADDDSTEVAGGDAADAAGTQAGTPAAAPDAAGDASGTPVRFTTPDGQELAGTMYGDGPTGVVLAHMRGRDQGTWADFAADAAAAGHRVLTFDFRGSPKPQNPKPHCKYLKLKVNY